MLCTVAFMVIRIHIDYMFFTDLRGHFVNVYTWVEINNMYIHLYVQLWLWGEHLHVCICIAYIHLI